MLLKSHILQAAAPAAKAGKDLSAKEKAQSKKGKSAEKSPAAEQPQQLAGAVGEAVILNAKVCVGSHANLPYLNYVFVTYFVEN